ncbi:LIM domain kinase 1 [Orchesella cincta]|uniref:LIM domain kinase 1 n=1 Tax=Orchesella cincta TaxID=48709 RepID=A0A1D2N938_ORCCI|nr:LIM domain kinase 1 [Orchesella cincta]
MANCRGTCHRCGETAVGLIMTAGAMKFHPECFLCCRCQSCIGDDEQYILVGLSTLYCGGCWKKEPFPLLEKQHIIKVVTIPPLNRDGTQYKLKTDWNDCVTYDECPTVPQVSEIGRHGPECQLSVGDRILEVNGAPVHDRPIPDIEKILNQRTSVVQVTVEQTPTPEMPARKLEESKSFGSLSSLELRSWDLWGSYSDVECYNKDRLTNKKRDEHRSRASRRSKGSRERAASLSRLSDSSPTPPNHSRPGLARTLSFREQARSQCTFRACDLVKGELLGKGFFGQVNIVS